MLPEEEELARLEAEQDTLNEKVVSAEVALGTLRSETIKFQFRYYQQVGHLYAYLDKIEAKIAAFKAAKSPGSKRAKVEAEAAEQAARKSAQELESSDAQTGPSDISPTLKQAFSVHPRTS